MSLPAFSNQILPFCCEDFNFVRCPLPSQESETETANLAALSVKELRAMLSKMNISCPSGLEKSELAAFVQEHANKQKQKVGAIILMCGLCEQCEPAISISNALL